MKNDKISIFGVDFNNLSMNDAIEAINEMIVINNSKGVSSFVVTPNVDHLVNINKDQKFNHIYKKASLKLVDGMPIVILAKLLKKPFKDKVSGADLTPALLQLAKDKGYKVFVFGSRAGVAEKVSNMYKKKYGTSFQIETYSPPFGFENDTKELNYSLKKINEFKPDLLLVSLGSPKGEFFISNNLDSLNVPVSIQVGAAIDFIAGTVKRAPVWMQNYSLEWFYRFIKEPKRMFKRYFINDIYFIRLIFKEIVKK